MQRFWIVVWIGFAAWLFSSLAIHLAASTEFVVLDRVRLYATEAERIEGYYGLGTSTALVVKVGTPADMRLTDLNGKTVTLVLRVED